LPSRGITKGVSSAAAGGVNSNFNGNSEWEEVRNFNICVIITRYTGFVQVVPLKTGLFLDMAVQVGWL
jgi:hypothetical protein